MKNFTDILNKYQGGIDADKLKKGIEIELSVDEAIEIFGERVVHRNIDIGLLSVHYYLRRKGDKIRLFVKVTDL